ncbi:uncharacterized protein LOC134237214 [Saccostrea cucullata]|uniref:uncharacterized protein LOC134237214 n=1 Tax=Saccostrea cuccullata TaxID=36930 RepID=UPI002ED653F2
MENDQLHHVKSELEKKKRGIVKTVEFMEENNSIMSDYSLIDNHSELTKMVDFDLKGHTTNCEYSVRFTRGEIKDQLLEALVGRTWDLDDIEMTQKHSFQYGEKFIFVLETISEDQCYIREGTSEYIEKVNNEGAKKQILRIAGNDICVTKNSNVYFADFNKKCISCLSSSGSASTVISTLPFVPIGICQSVDGGLLVSLRERELDLYKLESHSRRLVRHITVTGDVIHEYEYQEDGHTRLFTLPYRITQNSNSGICVVNRTNEHVGDLVVMTSSGCITSVYRGQNLKNKFSPFDVECDSLCNILVTDIYNKQIHLLSPDGNFLKFLLSDNEVNCPYTLSLYKSTLWVGHWEGLVKVFKYRV